MLADQDWAREKLAPYRRPRVLAGRRAAVGDVDACRRTARSAAAPADAVADLELALSPLSVPSFLADPTRWNEFVARGGRRRLRRRAEGPRAHAAVVRRGNVRARRSARSSASAWPTPAASCSRFPEYAAQRVAESAGSYARDEAGLLARGADLRQLRDDVDEVADARRRARRSASTRWRRACARSADERDGEVRAPHRRRLATLAKFSRPRLYNVQKRERLFQLLDERRAHPIIWIAGPPGSGKSTLVASYVEARKLPGVWFQADPGDADPATFFHYLRTGGRRAAGAAREATRRRCRCSPPSTRATCPRSRAASCASSSRCSRRARCSSSTTSTSPRPTPAWRFAFAEGLREIPQGLNLIFLSREPPVARDGAAGRRAAHHAHRVGGAALHRPTNRRR